MVDVIQGLRQTARRIKRRIGGRALILLYHRVDELTPDPYLLAVTPKHFAEHLEVVRRQGRPMGLRELAQCLREGRVPSRAIAITFDDGYLDNLYNAKPLLEHYGIPATIFVTTRPIAYPREFWWDELARLLLQPGTLPKVLRWSVNGSSHRYELGEAADYGEDDTRRHRDWHVERADDPGPRHRLFRLLYQSLFSLGAEERQQVLDEIQAQSRLTPDGSTGRAMAPDEIVHMAKDGLVEIGAHTVTHPALAMLPAAAQREEILQSKQQLEQLLGKPVATFAYPHGSLTPETVAIVRDAGFVCAGSSETDVVWSNTDSFRLPRVGIRDWDGETFTRWLRAWFGS